MENITPPLQSLSDQALVDRIRRQDVDAFSVLYDRYARPVYLFAAYLLDPPEAEEVVQEVFLRLWKKAGLYQAERGMFNTWLMSITRHLVLDRIRSRGRQRLTELVEEIDQLLLDPTGAGWSVEEEVSRRSLGEVLLQALHHLPDEQRRALVMAYFGGLSQSAIAEQLGLPLGTVKKRTRLGLQKLRAALASRGWFVERPVQEAAVPNPRARK